MCLISMVYSFGGVLTLFPLNTGLSYTEILRSALQVEIEVKDKICSKCICREG